MCTSAPFPYWHGITSPDDYCITELGKKYGINGRNPLLPWCARLQAVTGHFPSHHAVSQQPFWTSSSCRPLCISHHRQLHSPAQLFTPRFTPTHARKLVSQKWSIQWKSCSDQIHTSQHWVSSLRLQLWSVALPFTSKAELFISCKAWISDICN